MRDYHARSKQTDYKPKSKGPKNRITDEEVERVWNKLKGRTTPDDRWGRSPLEDM